MRKISELNADESLTLISKVSDLFSEIKLAKSLVMKMDEVKKLETHNNVISGFVVISSVIHFLLDKHKDMLYSIFSLLYNEDIKIIKEKSIIKILSDLKRNYDTDEDLKNFLLMFHDTKEKI